MSKKKVLQIRSCLVVPVIPKLDQAEGIVCKTRVRCSPTNEDVDHAQLQDLEHILN